MVRSHPDLPSPSDAFFIATSRRILAATGLAAPGDPQSCRSATVRVGEHEIRIITPLVRPDGTIADPGRDRALALAVCHLVDASAQPRHQVAVAAAARRPPLVTPPSSPIHPPAARTSSARRP
ncbi:hypothetical protein [Streptacidiphilus sp. MAP5-52]|uniref:hypothetical protein n=1 Tax=Streptacidiphilus sp. MAP5-52 TaxID=3156267 RepID=UPI003515296F